MDRVLRLEHLAPDASGEMDPVAAGEQPESALHYAVSPFRDRDAGVVPGSGVGFWSGAAREALLG